ncbi:MAG: hypothetical protein WA919_23240 [Coleofasciculaceae cyanobacterium]
MLYISSSSKILSSIICFTCFVSPAAAHNVKTNADVGATFHIEPNHNPRAGETARAWFALTQSGGKLIPLEQCDCQLAVYSKSSTEGNQPQLQPSLQAISAEQYQGIPGAEIIFPEAGAYELQLKGTPQAGADFQPFELKYTVNVTTGKTTPKSSPQTKQELASLEEQTAVTGWYMPVIILLVILVVGSLWFIGQRLQSRDR